MFSDSLTCTVAHVRAAARGAAACTGPSLGKARTPRLCVWGTQHQHAEGPLGFCCVSCNLQPLELTASARGPRPVTIVTVSRENPGLEMDYNLIILKVEKYLYVK